MMRQHARTLVCGMLVLLTVLSGCKASSPAATPSLVFPSLPPTVHVAAAQGTVYYVRTNGGDASQCTGLADAAYPGSGTGQPCAWDHPFRALPPGGSPRISNGDTLIIGPGEYRMGYDAPGADACEADSAYDCHMPPIPSGPNPANPTRILGAGWDAGCTSPPQLWGAERPWFILNLTDSDNIEIACFEITDHAACVESHSGDLACQRDTYPFGEYADLGLYAEDSTNVTLRHLNIHGLAVGGVRAGRLTDWTLEDVRIAGNGWVGWDGDIDGDDANSGTLTFRRWTVEWNGCGETYPGGEPTGCWGQSAGGYGDGVGTGETGGHWVIEDSAFLHNTSDGLDLLYTRQEGSSVEIRRTIAEGNAGDQIKTSGPTVIENVIAVSNCGFFEGKPFAYRGDFDSDGDEESSVDNCRAGGSAIALTLRDGNAASVINSTVTGQGDCLLITECQEGYSCGGSESVLLRNDIFQGNPEFGGGDTTCFAWHGTAQDPFAVDHAIINGTKATPDPCPPDSFCGVSPDLVNADISSFDAHLLPGSPAIDAGDNTACPGLDYFGNPRPTDGDGDENAICDIGAHERWEPTAWLYLPLILRNT
ncbi:MAG: choice-of-anchor Q domain-containing protein [Chloroflexota bacterium]